MKKFILVIMLILCISSLFATESEQISKKNELSFKVGYLSPVEYIVLGLSTISHAVDEDTKDFSLPSLSVEYLYYVNNNIGLGGTFTYGIPALCVGETSTSMGQFVALQGTFRVNYANLNKVKLYGELGLGAELLINPRIDLCRPFFAAHFSPIGILFGTEKFFGTIECTLGTEGCCATAGCGFRF